ncbi:hypothetical protein BJY00DRAFT_319654 [Aspergillus carlsbadensis]|nr:hypothetical protein BJY00DRAFT_319654 [Aspergillus carlsbadensis]
MASILPNTTNKRRFHHKSRYGCTPCKRRRTKCDEKKPTCTNCSQRFIKCSFSDLVPAPRNQRPTHTAKHQAKTPEPSIPAKVSGPGLVLPFCRQGTRDLELYCHFQIFTVPTLADPGDLAALFRDEIPKQSIAFPFLGHGLLSVAYIHFAGLAQHEPSRKLLLADGAFHINRALPEYLASIKNITRENFCAVYEFAIFVVLFTFATTSEDCTNLLQTAQDRAAAENQLWKRRNRMTDLAKKAAQVAQSIQNIFGIFWRCQEWFAASPVFPTVQRHTPPMLSEGSINWIRVEDGHLASLSLLWEEDAMVPMEHSSALSDSLASLRETFAMVTQLTVLPPTTHQNEDTIDNAAGAGNDLQEIHRNLSAGRLDDMPCVFTWFVRLSPTLISLLESGDPHAMVILAHYAIVLDRACSEKWWIHRLPRRFVQIAELVLGGERRAWIDWPLAVVSG